MKSVLFFNNEAKFRLIFLFLIEYAYGEDVINLIRIKVIKVKPKIKIFMLFTLICLLLLNIAATFVKNHVNHGSNSVISGNDVQVKKQKNFLHNVDNKVFKRILHISLPILDYINEVEGPSIDLKKSTSFISRTLTNIDVLNPETYFFMHLPVISLINTEMAMTPGVELPIQDSDIITENEHEPSEELPQPQINEIENNEVEKLEPISGQPLVLIYHTHTTEAYMPSEKFNYKPRDNTYHTEDLNYTVVKVGEVMASQLNRLKIPTMHNKTVHDIPTYMTSYANSLKTVEQILKQNPSIKIIIDLHRDAPVADAQKSREITTVKIDGTTYSRLMLVIGTDKNFPHPNWQENYQFANLLNDKLEQLYPGISRGINLRSERFNQHLSKKAILLEIGSHGNTLEESIKSAEIFAKVLADIIKELSIVE